MTELTETEIAKIDGMIFFKDGDYVAKGGFFVRNTLRDFFKVLIESGEEPVGIRVDMESYNLEILVKQK